MSEVLTVKVATSLTAIPAQAWDICARGLPLAGETPETKPAESLSEEDRDNPFTCHAFLLALEASGCTGGRTG
ncbi:MAG: GNAT family N-acetyltransferase, partial [Bosea sp. (in: a-proteobacteria)]